MSTNENHPNSRSTRPARQAPGGCSPNDALHQPPESSAPDPESTTADEPGYLSEKLATGSTERSASLNQPPSSLPSQMSDGSTGSCKSLPAGNDPLDATEQYRSPPPAGKGCITDVRENDRTVITSDLSPIIELPSTQQLSPPIQESISSLSAIAPGTQLGHYEIQEYIGGGGMGSVYRAIDTALDRPVAIKVLSRSRENDQETIARFINEAKSAARLNHQNIAQVYYAGEQSGVYFIAFEYVQGTNIRSIIEHEGTLSLPRVISYALQIAYALKHQSDNGVVHRDIKPSNVLIEGHDRAKLIDMGLARLLKPEDSGADLTASGITLGTFDYISPEQARDPRLADVRSDIYSLGCTTFYMLAGRPPFPEGTVLQKLLQHQGDEPPDIRQFRLDVPDDVSQVIRKMMSKDPRHRFQTPERLIDALVLLAERIGLQPIGPSHSVWVVPREAKRSQAMRHLPWIVPLAAVLLGVVMLNYWWNPETNISDVPEPFPGVSMQFTGQPNTPLPPGGTQNNEPTDPSTPTAQASGTTTSAQNDSVATGASNVGANPGTSSRPADTLPVTRPATYTSLSGSGDDLATYLPMPEAALNWRPISSTSGSGSENSSNSGSATDPGVSSANSNPPVSLANTASLASTTGLHVIDVPLECVALDYLAASMPSSMSSEPLPVGVGSLTYSPGNATSAANPSSQTTDPSLSNLPQLLVVSPGQKLSGSYATLAEACSVAPDQAVIELQFDGPIREHPITISNRSLTIRAAKGYSPEIEFKPTEDDLLRYSQSMLTLIRSSLKLEGVLLTLDVPQDVATDRWSLLEMCCGDQLDFRRCHLTIRNVIDLPDGQCGAFHEDTAFFRTRPLPNSGILLPATAPLSSNPEVRITLSDSLVRGEAVVLRAESGHPISWIASQTLMTSTEPILLVSGTDKKSVPDPEIRLAFDRVTASTPSAFCYYEADEFAPHVVPTNFNIKNSVLRVYGGTLIYQTGINASQIGHDSINWSGTNNYYEAIASAWYIRPYGVESETETYSIPAWSSRWTVQPLVDQLTWNRLPEPLDAPSSQTAVDFAFDPIETAMVGCDISRLTPPSSADGEQLPPDQPLTTPSVGEL